MKLVTMLGVLLAVLPIIAKADDSMLECTLSLPSPQSAKAGIWFEFSLRNKSDETLYVLPWLTPLEGFMSELVTVTSSDGRALAYQGPKIKRPAPTQEDYMAIAAGDTVTNRINLLLAYDLTPGTYEITSKPYRLLYKRQDVRESLYLCPPTTVTLTITD